MKLIRQQDLDLRFEFFHAAHTKVLPCFGASSSIGRIFVGADCPVTATEHRALGSRATLTYHARTSEVNPRGPEVPIWETSLPRAINRPFPFDHSIP